MIRNDFVSNSSSCSFIIRVSNEEDLKQLSKPEVVEVLKKYAREVSDKFNMLPYGTERSYGDVTGLNVGDFIRIYNGEDNDYWDCHDDPTCDLIDIFEKINKDYDKLEHYRDDDAHVSIGDYYKEKKDD